MKLLFFKKFLFIIFLFSPVFVLADYNFSTQSGLNVAANKTGHSDQKVFRDSEDISVSIGNIIQALIAFVGVVFMILLVYGGVLWMTARGNDQQVEKAKKIIAESIIGLAIVVSAYAISVLVISNFNFQ